MNLSLHQGPPADQRCALLFIFHIRGPKLTRGVQWQCSTAYYLPNRGPKMTRGVQFCLFPTSGSLS
jgi:hypothetical protein